MGICKEEFGRRYVERFQALHGVGLEDGTKLDQYRALASLVKEELAADWVKSNKSYDKKKQVYYFAMEFLPGRFLAHNLTYRGLRETIREGLQKLGIDLRELEEMEREAALGSGGLGRLGACFLDSMASMGLAGHGCCLRYQHGLFRQKIVDGFQVELADRWLKDGNVWETEKRDKAVTVRFKGTVRTEMDNGRLVFIHDNYELVKAVPYDIPVAGYRNGVINTLRLWQAEAFSAEDDCYIAESGGHLPAHKQSVETISRVLYPDDSQEAGKLLRLKQQYFLVSAGMQSIINRFKRKGGSLPELADYVAVHINDTHPALCIPELMRILIDEEGMGWDEAWRVTCQVISYTNHTILPEALEKWPVEMIKTLLPRIYLLIEEINERFCQEVCRRHKGDWQKAQSMAIISRGEVQMARLALVGSHRVNGVSLVHSRLLRECTMKQFYEVYPHKFTNKTNGVSHRRFLLEANPRLASLINETIGPEWVKSPEKLLGLKAWAADHQFLKRLAEVKRENKKVLAERIQAKYGIEINPDSIFDVHIKRIHAYKRQLLNVLHIMDLYNRLQENPGLSIVPRTFIFAGKAAPGYVLAKKIIKLINTVAAKVNTDKTVAQKLKVVFLENYNVSLAEMIIPAADVSEQLSTAGKEASGTGNMKFMLNGAVTIGTLDGANVEIWEEVGPENMVSFGLTIDDVHGYYRRGDYLAKETYSENPRLKTVVDQLVSGFLPAAPEEFREIHTSLLAENDEFFVLQDFASYVAAQEEINRLYQNGMLWRKMCALNIAHAGRFSSDRTVAEYARDIWGVAP